MRRTAEKGNRGMGEAWERAASTKGPLGLPSPGAATVDTAACPRLLRAQQQSVHTLPAGSQRGRAGESGGKMRAIILRVQQARVERDRRTGGWRHTIYSALTTIIGRLRILPCFSAHRRRWSFSDLAKRDRRERRGQGSELAEALSDAGVTRMLRGALKMA